MAIETCTSSTSRGPLVQGASEDLRCPSVYTLRLMWPCRPPCSRASTWVPCDPRTANIKPRQLLKASDQQAPLLINYDLSIFTSAHRRYVIIDIVLVVCLRLSATTTVLYSSKFGVIHLTNSPYLIIYCDERTSMPYPWHHPLLHQDLCPLVQYHDLMWISYD